METGNRMRESIERFHEQFAFEPVIREAGYLSRHSRGLVCGMGGSNLAPDLIRACHPTLDLQSYRSYGLPPLPPDDLKERLVILVSHSGNTEETIDAFHRAGERGLHRAVIASGGELLALAARERVPHVALPRVPHLQPRLALGFHAKALLALMGERDVIADLTALSHTLRAADYAHAALRAADLLRGKVPMVCASDRNAALARSWKIVLNETAKIPAFWNVFPELNHNEMTGFDREAEASRPLSDRFAFIFLEDAGDHPRIRYRMAITRELYEARELPVVTIPLRDPNPWRRAFGCVLTASWAALALAERYGAEPNEVPMVEEFKRRFS